MRIGRVQRDGIDGPEPRIVLVDLERDAVVDVRRCEEARLIAAGNSLEAARRLASARVPDSLSSALGALAFEDFVREATAQEPPSDAVLPMAEARWLAAVDAPRFRDCMSFEQHVVTARHVLGKPVADVLYELPVYYKGSHQTLIGHGQAVAWPAYSEWMDYELELGFVVGRGGVDLTPDEAARCLFGVTLINDLSARDRQFRETGSNLGPAKGKDFATVVGPWITTVDDVDLASIELTARVNGEIWATGTSGSAMWTPAELLAYLSTAEPLVPGELVGSGTVGGGCGLEVGRRLTPGDVIELEGAGLGLLQTTLRPQVPIRWTPEIRSPGVTIDGRGVHGLAPALPPRTDAPPPPLPRREFSPDRAIT